MIKYDYLFANFWHNHCITEYMFEFISSGP